MRRRDDETIARMRTMRWRTTTMRGWPKILKLMRVRTMMRLRTMRKREGRTSTRATTPRTTATPTARTT
eukprot:6605403-Pyramimonas_sp.AAC.1